jgi:hypothetical protein
MGIEHVRQLRGLRPRAFPVTPCIDMGSTGQQGLGLGYLFLTFICIQTSHMYVTIYLYPTLYVDLC